MFMLWAGTKFVMIRTDRYVDSLLKLFDLKCFDSCQEGVLLVTGKGCHKEIIIKVDNSFLFQN